MRNLIAGILGAAGIVLACGVAISADMRPLVACMLALLAAGAVVSAIGLILGEDN